MFQRQHSVLYNIVSSFSSEIKVTFENSMVQALPLRLCHSVMLLLLCCC